MGVEKISNNLSKFKLSFKILLEYMTFSLWSKSFISKESESLEIASSVFSSTIKTGILNFFAS